MKSSDLVLDFIEKNCSYTTLLQSLQANKTLGIQAEDIQQALGIVRNNASTILNQLHKKGQLIKINSRPVTFITKKNFQKFCQNHSPENKETYTLNELTAILQEKSSITDPFSHLLGNNGSLTNQISQAKAAIVYPPAGLHTLLLGASGVGKTTFAAAMHTYGLHVHKKKSEEFPFITFNCADYFNNPQLLLSQLFGHTKNAFTGANQDKVGLVEKANGGILFLDEIHRLPPDGQEMLFYLMDKGEYNRLGESSSRRKSNLLIIAATTENPDDTLLTTFKRRIPVTINLPAFNQKPIFERIEIVDHFFKYESINLNRSITLAPEVLKALAIYTFKTGNIGQLRSEIKLLCANAFLQYLQDNQTIYIDFSLLNKDIKEGMFHLEKLDSETKHYLSMFSENIVISPDKEKNDYPFELLNNDIYNQMSNKLTDLRRQGLNNDTIHEVLKKDVDEYFSCILKSIHTPQSNIQTLYKVIPKEIVDTTVKLVEFAEHQLATKFKDKFIFGLCFHIHALLKRLNTNPIMPTPQLSKVQVEHLKEFQVSQAIIKKLEKTFHTLIPPYEQGFLALLLSQNKLDAVVKNCIGIIIICHGNSTASSIAAVANTLLNTAWLKAIDMPLSTTIDETYKKFRSVAISVHRGKGILLLVDMRSLVDFGKRLTKETGIQVSVAESISTPLALELLRKVLYKTDELDTIYNSILINNVLPITTNRRPAILSVCITGEGASKMVKDILENTLQKKYRQIFDIIVTNYLDVKKDYPKLQATHNFIVSIGNIDPELDIPYFPIGQLMEESGRKKFLTLLNTSLPTSPQEELTILKSKNVYDKACLLLEKYVKYINSKVAIKHIKNFINDIHYSSKNDEQLLDFTVHLGCMLDRCIHRDAIYFENIRQFKQDHLVIFKTIRNAIASLEKIYDIQINDDEVCYIIKLIEVHA